MLLPRDGPLPPASPGFPSVDPGQYENTPLYNHRGFLLGLTITFMVFAWICSLLRFYARAFVTRPLGWDDMIILFALLSSTQGSVLLCVMTDYGLGTSIYAMSLSEVEEMMKLSYIGNASYPTSAAFIKIALLLQYLRIFEPGKGEVLVCKIMIALSTVWLLVFGLLTWMPCIPVYAYWDFTVQGATCFGLGSRNLPEFLKAFVAQALSTAILDFIVFVIPVRLYFRADADRKTRISLIVLFVLGLSVNLCSIWRTVYVIKLFADGTGPSHATFDPCWYSPTTAGLACLEVHLATVCASLPVFWPVLKSRWHKIFVTTTVSVTNEYGRFPSRQAKEAEVEIQRTSSERNGTQDSATQEPKTWEPFVGDEKTGLGENETVVQSPAGGRRARTVGEVFRKLRPSR